jgi:hypothetical protein
MRVLHSVLAALLGVQSKRNMEKDFELNKPHLYAIAGAIVCVILILTLIYIVISITK